MELFDSKIKKFPHIFSKVSFFYISGNEILYFLSPSSKNKKNLPLENLLYFNSKTFLIFSYILGNKNLKKIIYISGETSKSPKTKISYISSKKVMNKLF